MDIQDKSQVKKAQKRPVGSTTTDKIWVAGYLIISLSALTVYFLLKLHVFHVFGDYLVLLQKIALGTCIATLILMFAKLLEGVFARRTRVVYTRYNLTKMVRLLSWLLIIAVGISFLFQNWYSAAVSLGLISLILGFALQNPISSFIGWLYILIRQPYHVGDRIQIETFKGDVVEVNYLDTTLWEFSGDYLTNDLPSGRLIRFPNSLVLQSAVLNYSWEKFPYIWNEIPFHVAYESDLKFVEETIKRIAKAELGDMATNIERYKELVEQTPVDELEIKEYPFVSFRIHMNTWVEVMVTYLVEPKRATAIRSILIQKILSELNQQPERVLFPNTNNR
ncbi:MAG: mechanosensitive ion channel family protein [Crocinitomicaceae bacterium]|jgi:small-conductance mechanosensitive channel|nr:mechanosensitive ion channel family protein [Crocinitomicaceae bacterium]